jgi:threonine dehydrogenase-like Zn-dependent dehydrogenase
VRAQLGAPCNASPSRCHHFADRFPDVGSIAQSRLDFAKTLVPSVKTVLIERGMDHIAASQAIKKAAGMDLKVALECTGVQSSVWSSIFSLQFGGKCFIMCAPSPPRLPSAWLR